MPRDYFSTRTGGGDRGRIGRLSLQTRSRMRRREPQDRTRIWREERPEPLYTPRRQPRRDVSTPQDRVVPGYTLLPGMTKPRVKRPTLLRGEEKRKRFTLLRGERNA